MSFVFPDKELLQKLQTIPNLAFLRNQLRISSSQLFPNCNRIFHIFMRHKNQRNQQIEAKCDNCSARLVYRKSQQPPCWKLTHSRNEHGHVPVKNFRNLRHQRYNQVLKLISNEQNIQKSKDVFKDLQISQTQLMKIKKNISNGKEEFLLEFLSKNQLNYQINHWKSSQKEHLFVISNTLMMKLVAEYGDAVYLETDIYSSMELTSYGIHSLGLLLGINSKSKTSVFAILLLPKQNVDIIRKLYRLIIKQLQINITTLFTRNSIVLSNAFEQLTTSNELIGKHKVNPYRLITQFKLSNQARSLLEDLLGAVCLSEYKQKEQIIKSQKDKLNVNQDILLKIYRAWEDMNVIREREFIGIGFSGFRVSSLKREAKKIFEGNKEFGEKLLSFMKLCDQKNKKALKTKLECYPYQEVGESDRQIYKISKIVPKKVFEIFYRQYMYSIGCNIKIKSDSIIQVFENISYEIFEVRINEQCRFQCTCLFTERTGIPCRHLIKVMHIKSQSIDKCFMNRWLNEPLLNS